MENDYTSTRIVWHCSSSGIWYFICFMIWHCSGVFLIFMERPSYHDIVVILCQQRRNWILKHMKNVFILKKSCWTQREDAVFQSLVRQRLYLNMSFNLIFVLSCWFLGRTQWKITAAQVSIPTRPYMSSYIYSYCIVQTVFHWVRESKPQLLSPAPASDFYFISKAFHIRSAAVECLTTARRQLREKMNTGNNIFKMKPTVNYLETWAPGKNHYTITVWFSYKIYVLLVVVERKWCDKFNYSRRWNKWAEINTVNAHGWQWNGLRSGR